MMDKLIKFASAFFLKEVAQGTESPFWKSIQKSKSFGALLILAGGVAYMFGLADFDKSSASVSAGLALIFLRDGQSNETEKVRGHLEDQDIKLNKQKAVLDTILRELREGK